MFLSAYKGTLNISYVRISAHRISFPEAWQRFFILEIRTIMYECLFIVSLWRISYGKTVLLLCCWLYDWLPSRMVYNREPEQKSIIIIMLDTRRDIIAQDIQQGISIKLRLSSVVTLNGCCITFSSLWNYFIKSVQNRANERKKLVWCDVCMEVSQIGNLQIMVISFRAANEPI